MALNLIHGDNQFQSRSYFNQLLDSYKDQGFKDVVSHSGKSITLEETIQASESDSFFNTKRLLIIDSLISSPKSNRKKEIIDYLSSLDPKHYHTLIWEPKPVTPSQAKKLNNFTAKPFKSSPSIFKFLDSLRPNNISDVLKFYSLACKQDSAEFVFYMLVKRIRQLLQLSDGELKLAPWQLSRLKQQLSHYKVDQLIQFHTQLFELDHKQKSGGLTLNLESDLEMILINQN